MKIVPMLTTIASALAVYISTSIDDLFILMLFFSHVDDKRGYRSILAAQYLGVTTLVCISLIAAFFLQLVPQTWIIGFLGLVPIALAFRSIWESRHEEQAKENAGFKHSSVLFWNVTLVTISAGGDNIGIYIPYFATFQRGELSLILIVFAFMISLFCYLGYRFSRISFMDSLLKKYAHIITPTVFFCLGLFILHENGTFEKLLNL